MSCWRKYTANILKNVDIDMLHKACQDMEFDFDESIKYVSSAWENRAITVDAGLVKDGEPLTLGFKFRDKDGSLTVEGDFWKTGLDERTFIGTLSQEYAKHSLTYQLEFGLGMTIESCQKNDNGQIIIEAYAG